MAMGRESKFMPILIFFFLAMFIFGFVRMINGFKPTVKVLSYKESLCNEMLISEAIIHAQSSECMSYGSLNVYDYECNEDIGRVDFPIVLTEERVDGKIAECTVFTSSGNSHLLWINNREVE
jgi:hypothetical protein